MTSHSGETVTSTPLEATQPEAHDIQRSYNVWHGLYEEARQGYLRLDGVDVHRRPNDSAVGFALPNQAAGLIADHTAQSDDVPATMSITHAVQTYATEDGYTRRLHMVGLTQDGSPGICKVIEQVFDKRQRTKWMEPIEQRPVVASDMERLNAIFDELQTLRARAYQKRAGSPTETPSSVGLRGLATLLQGKKKRP